MISCDMRDKNIKKNDIILEKWYFAIAVLRRLWKDFEPGTLPSFR